MTGTRPDIDADSAPHGAEAGADAAAVPLRAALAENLAGQGVLDSPAWRSAVETVPRHRFVAGFYAPSGHADGLTVWEPVTARAAPARWLETVYSDTTLITQFDGDEPDWTHPAARLGGAPTSSSTLPSLVVQMWADAGLADGHNVLEVGTGTGYSTALACQRLAGTGEVTSIEVDPRRLEQAAGALYGCGYSPDLAVADGLWGYWPSAPFDRIVAACSVRRVPSAWLAQTTPGGRILTTLSGWLYGYARVLLTVTGSHIAEGPLLPGTISFMAARRHERPAPGNPAHWAHLTSASPAREARHAPTRLDEATLTGFFARFLAQLAAPNAQVATQPVDGGRDVRHLLDVTTGSAATLTATTGGGYNVRQAGPRRLWDDIETAWDAWDHAGRPGPEAFRMRIDQDRQTITNPHFPELTFTLP
ncbi:ATP-grasp peptide maturase system methyltransferase [Actinomadura harenae]|uniref:Protein-L-isoaspartate O-methyltransferase n=1 Tax=Actinomadura harenae TaxID=2483351 RepID=A0A3M2M1K2_9ACTN|nr:ATP-grasp peptide maturase system methyltransferase [Actinomadura harenae]RMI43322.1 SAM-dependent methyltransferase [Actinomadura harenae]